jgi:hypothetical protein
MRAIIRSSQGLVFLSLAVLLGCHHTETYHYCCRPPVQPRIVYRYLPKQVPPDGKGPATVFVAPAPVLASAPVPAAASPPVAKPAPPPAVPDVSQGPVTFTPHKFSQRRTFSDLTARPGFAHAPDHSWLIGELTYLPSKKVWRLRYASVEEDDCYHGSVILLDPGPLTGYHSGEMVRVDGQMVSSMFREFDPPYRVLFIQPLEGQRLPDSPTVSKTPPNPPAPEDHRAQDSSTSSSTPPGIPSPGGPRLPDVPPAAKPASKAQAPENYHVPLPPPPPPVPRTSPEKKPVPIPDGPPELQAAGWDS